LKQVYTGSSIAAKPGLCITLGYIKEGTGSYIEAGTRYYIEASRNRQLDCCKTRANVAGPGS